MNEDHRRGVQVEWETAWKWFDDTLADLGQGSGGVWDPWAVAVFADVPALTLAGSLRAAREAGLTDGFDLVARVRTPIRRAMERLRELGVGDAHEPLRLEFGLTGLLLRWEWVRMEEAGDDPESFFERLRELRLRIPEVALCERTVHSFCRRVPPAGLAGGREA